jgi:hypothetical protein
LSRRSSKWPSCCGRMIMGAGSSKSQLFANTGLRPGNAVTQQEPDFAQIEPPRQHSLVQFPAGSRMTHAFAVRSSLQARLLRYTYFWPAARVALPRRLHILLSSATVSRQNSI